MCCSHASRSRARCRAGRAACALRLRRHECREHDVSGRERRVAPAASPGGVRPRSVSDVMLLQAHKRPAPFDHNYPRASFKPLTLPPAFVSGQHGTLHIYGGVNLGKTEWASSRFDNPLVINTRDGLRGFRAGVHDGIVLDKMCSTLRH